MKMNLMGICFSLIIFTGFFIEGYAYAGDFKMGVHSGYGVIKLKENENYPAEKFESKYTNPTVLFGGSGEYVFRRVENLFMGVEAEWVFGGKDEEQSRRDGVKVQSNDLKIFGQFYDIKIGCKKSLDNFRYRLYLSGGWSGMRFRRENYIWLGSPLEKTSTEDISLWRIGTGTALGYKIKEWTIDGKIVYSYYPDGEIRDSSVPDVTFDAEGSILDIEVAFARNISANMNLSIGANYVLQKLGGTESTPDVSWKTQLEIMAGKVALTYMF